MVQRVPQGEGLISVRNLTIAQIEFELILGLLLLTNALPRIAWPVSLLSFSVFAIVSMHKIIRGDASCGCFGQVPIAPWYTAAIDVLLVALLWLWRDGVIAASSRQSRRIAFAVSVVLLCVPSTIWLVRSGPAVLVNPDQLIARDGMIYLQPDRWVGKPFPLRRYNSISDKLKTGQWIVVIYNSYCGHCRPAVPEYEQLAISLADRPGAPRIALLEVPPCAPPERNPATGMTPAIVGHLSSEQRWLAETPMVLAISDGKVVAVSGEESAEAFVGRVFPP